MRDPNFLTSWSIDARLLRQVPSEGSGGRPQSLMEQVHRVIRGSNNLDMNQKEFILHRDAELQRHVAERIREYEAMLTVIGYLSGAITPPPPMTTESLRNDIADALRKAGDSLIERSQRGEWGNYNPLNAASSAVGLYYFVLGGGADLLGFDQTAESYYNIGRTAANTDVWQLYSNSVNELTLAIWSGIRDYWDRFWETASTEGFLIAYGKLRIDAGFLAAELAIDIALGVITGGIAAGASRVVRIVGRRVGRTATRVTIKVGHSRQAIPETHRVLEVDIPDSTIPPHIERLMDEDNLGGAARLDDTALRA